MVERSVRQLERERVNMERQEKKLIADIKKMAAKGQEVYRRDGDGFGMGMVQVFISNMSCFFYIEICENNG